ncbi:MAG: LL-diaminopimelate aminotransferase [Eubacteriales bacterium]|nr:LL-diaminopimelate aminotransferase [Eubacteriales bacterium]
MRINRNYLQLPENYLFSEVAKRTREFQAHHPEMPIIKLSIGDVSRPLPAVVVQAMKQACSEMGASKTFRGYGPEIGYPWLRTAIADFYQKQCGVKLEADEIIISDGAKSDLSNLLDIFDPQATVAMCDPVYPVYLDTNLMLGRRPKFFRATNANNFLPMPNESVVADIIYLCNPSNPTGVCYNRAQLQQWVDFAREHGSVILYDAAYACFVREPELPRSIYEIDGARECAIEICSFSKMAGFTGVRCGYTVVPKSLVTADGVSLHQLWQRRQSTKFNGVSYIVQRGAAAIFTEQGLTAVAKHLAYYQRNVQMICQTLDKLHWSYVGGKNSPYVWVRCPGMRGAWEFFDFLLRETGIVCTPGIGFGTAGENYIRLTGFNSYANTRAACRRLLDLRQKKKR